MNRDGKTRSAARAMLNGNDIFLSWGSRFPDLKNADYACSVFLELCWPGPQCEERTKYDKWWWPPGLKSEPIFLGRGCDEALFSEKKGFSVKRGEAIQWMTGLVRISTGKAIQWRGSGHSLNRRTPKIEKLLSSSPSQKSALMKMSIWLTFCWLPFSLGRVHLSMALPV